MHAETLLPLLARDIDSGEMKEKKKKVQRAVAIPAKCHSEIFRDISLCARAARYFRGDFSRRRAIVETRYSFRRAPARKWKRRENYLAFALNFLVVHLVSRFFIFRRPSRGKKSLSTRLSIIGSGIGEFRSKTAAD